MESILDTNHVTTGTLSHTSNTQRENASAIFTSEKLDKLDDLDDALKELKINDAKFYVSNSATASDAQGDITCNPNTFTHTSNSKNRLRTLEMCHMTHA